MWNNAKTQEVIEYRRRYCRKEKVTWDSGNGQRSCGQEVVGSIRPKKGLRGTPREPGARSSPMESFSG